MKKILSSILALAAFGAAMVSCYQQDDIYKEYVVVGGYTYPAKSINMNASPGQNRVVLSWDLPMDPSIRTAKVFWDNYIDSLSVKYSDFADGHVSVSVDNLEERSYTFAVVNYDEKGNRSLASELTARPLGSSWLVTHSERRVVSCKMDGDTAVITMSRSTDEMVGTKFKVRDLKGNWKEHTTFMKADETVIRIPEVMKGKRFEFTSGYFETNAADTIWNPSWTKSSMGISYPIDASAWDLSLTANQLNASYPPALMFDGIVDDTKSRFFSTTSTSYRNVFPKIVAIDTKAEAGKEYTFTEFAYYINPTKSTARYIKAVNMYIGDSAYDPDIKTYATDYGTAALTAAFTQDEALQSKVLSNECKGRYLAIVFRTSWSSAGYIDLWELVPYGYLASEID